MSMCAHSAVVCQGISRTQPGVSLMLTPATSGALGNSRTVVCRPQPPSDKCMWLSAKDHLRFAIVPGSTRGGTSVSGFSASREGFVGPMIVAPSLPLIGRGRLENSICSPSCVLEKAIEHLLLLRTLSNTKAFETPNESACYDLSEDILNANQ